MLQPWMSSDVMPDPYKDRLLQLSEKLPDVAVDFSVNRQGEVVLHRAKRGPARKGTGDRFAAVRGRAEVKWRTRDLMKLLRDEP